MLIQRPFIFFQKIKNAIASIVGARTEYFDLSDSLLEDLSVCTILIETLITLIRACSLNMLLHKKRNTLRELYIT